jgi:hypothetical protein
MKIFCVEASGLFGHDSILLAEGFMTFLRITVPSSSGSYSPRRMTVSHSRKLESSTTLL